MENQDTIGNLKIHEEKYIHEKNEYRRLFYEIKKKESNRNSIHVKMKHRIQQQRVVLSKLEKEKAEQALQLKFLRNSSFANKSNKNLKRFKSSLRELVKNEEHLQSQNEALKKLDLELKKLNKKISKKHKEAVRLQQNTVKENKILNDVSFLEDRLYASLVKYNQVVVSNALLREDISSTLLSAKSFHEKYSRLQRLLKIGRKAIADKVHSATVTYQTGESVKYKLNIIKERTYVDQKKLGEKVKELKILVEQDKQFKKFLDLKTRDQFSTGNVYESNGQNDMLMEQHLQSCLNIMEKIHIVSDSKDVNNICKIYARQEECNLALFEKVNTMSLEIEKFHEDLKIQKQDLDVITNQYEEQKYQETKQRNDIENMTKNLSEEAQQLECQVESKIQDLEMVKEILRRIHILFHGITSQDISFTVDDGITDDNILQYLESLEQKILELLQCSKFIQNK